MGMKRVAEENRSFQFYLDKGYEKLEQENDPAGALEYWKKAWEEMKAVLDRMEYKPEIEEMDQEIDREIQGNVSTDTWMFDVCRVMLQERRYEENTEFCQELLERFTWPENGGKVFEQMI